MIFSYLTYFSRELDLVVYNIYLTHFSPKQENAKTAIEKMYANVVHRICVAKIGVL